MITSPGTSGTPVRRLSSETQHLLFAARGKPRDHAGLESILAGCFLHALKVLFVLPTRDELLGLDFSRKCEAKNAYAHIHTKTLSKSNLSSLISKYLLFGFFLLKPWKSVSFVKGGWFLNVSKTIFPSSCLKRKDLIMEA